MVDIFDEVDEELRADRAQALFKRYAGHLIVGAVLIVALTGGWQGWRWWEARRDMATAESFLAAMRMAEALPADSPGPAKLALAERFQALAADAPAGYRTLARLRAAGLRASASDLTTALTLWNEVADDTAADPILRDHANLLWVQHQIDTADAGQSHVQLQARLAPLMTAGNPWRALAAEAAALIELRLGRTEQARTALKALTIDTTAPDGVRARANGLLAQLGG